MLVKSREVIVSIIRSSRVIDNCNRTFQLCRSSSAVQKLSNCTGSIASFLTEEDPETGTDESEEEDTRGEAERSCVQGSLW